MPQLHPQEEPCRSQWPAARLRGAATASPWPTRDRGELGAAALGRDAALQEGSRRRCEQGAEAKPGRVCQDNQGAGGLAS